MSGNINMNKKHNQPSVGDREKIKEEFIQEFHAIFGHEFDNNIEVMWNWIDQAIAQKVKKG